MDWEGFFSGWEGKRTLSVGRSGPATAAHVAARAVSMGKRVAIAVRSRDALLTMRGLVTLFTPGLSVGSEDGAPGRAAAQAERQKPAWEKPWVCLPPVTERTLTREGWAERISALYALRHRTSPGIIFSADNLALRFPPCDYLDPREITLRRGDEMDPSMLMEQLAEWGYQRVPLVAHAGDMARRGDIFDVLPPGYERPLRLEFFGDSIEEIRVFDFATQRSAGSLEDVVLLPVSPVCMDRQERDDARAWWKELARRGVLREMAASTLEHGLEQGDARLFPGSLSRRASLLEEWFAPETLLILPGRGELKESLAQAEGQWRDFLRRQSEETSLAQPEHLVLRGADEAWGALERFARMHVEPLLSGPAQEGVIDMQERSLHRFTDLFPGLEGAERPWQQLCNGLREWMSTRRQVVLAFSSDRGRAKFLKLSAQEGLYPNLRYDPDGRGLCAVVAPFRTGAELAWCGTLVIGEDLLQPNAEARQRAPSSAFKGMASCDGLQPGDLLVHRDYGIGRFGGLHRMSPGGNGEENDYLLLEYAEGARLWLPVDRLSVVQKFKAEGEAPALDKLGGTAWVASREKARKAVEKVAADLMQMYAWRKVAKGFSYSPVGEMYREFEATFGFEETPDQAKAIRDVLEDMEKPEPMDRLICGDVGFGKTEVALRAAFRAACDGRQTALLCPTTVLAEQHYQTFRSRLAGFPVNVGLLSRFVSRAHQQETLRAAARGQIDILIGTHRLLSSDVRLPNLGLLVLDEEQRFGVRHKEKLKELRRNVDVLTLTATPIPRTLQLSMSGVRELSVLETAPAERKPVATAIVDRDRGVIREIIARELAREGQVFFVHNRVQTLPAAADMVRSLAPDARVGMAHGQMPESELESTMHKFWRGELDILVCTAIVESGLDFPRANTLIVDQAQMFGLGQLYQLRGRVGRSDRQAYAVFVVNDADRLRGQARERLRIILELDYLGAGFQVAMEDLRLRGAGNILGEAQSGHMARVGLDLYLEMLEHAVSRLKGEEGAMPAETELNLGVAAHIPESYVEDARDRLKYYKMLSSAVDAAGRESVALELRDRYGPLPLELDSFLAALDLKSCAHALGIARADVFAGRIRVTWAQGQKQVGPEAIVRLALGHAGTVRLVPPATLELALDESLAVAERIRRAASLLGTLKEHGGA